VKGVKEQTESTRVQFLRTAQLAPSLLAFWPNPAAAETVFGVNAGQVNLFHNLLDLDKSPSSRISVGHVKWGGVCRSDYITRSKL
jgi:hypothetical protein